jgi:ABC-type transport system substrate-binding protein
VSGQIVVTDVDTHNGDLRGEIASFRANNEATGKGRMREESKVTHATCKSTLLPLSAKYRSHQIYTKPVDLAFFDGTTWNIMELKAGGDLDSSNAPSNVEKLLTIYVDMGIENCKAYFATLYNKDGEGNTWTGAVKKHLNYPSMFLIGAKFWERILPAGISYDEFTEIYREALEEIDLNKRINDMISDCIGE